MRQCTNVLMDEWLIKQCDNLLGAYAWCRMVLAHWHISTLAHCHISTLKKYKLKEKVVCLRKESFLPHLSRA